MEIIIGDCLTITEPDYVSHWHITRSNAFGDPAYAEAKRYERSTRFINRYLTTYREESGTLIVSRGYWHSMLGIADGARAKFIDQRSTRPVSIPALKNITLRVYQAEALDQASTQDQGLIIAPTGSGKTIIGLSMIRRRQERALILVHSRELAQQWRAEVHKLTGLKAGQIGGGQWQEGEHITIAMMQTLSKNPDRTRQAAAGYGLVLVDECHHVPATTFMKVIDMMPAKYRYGLTATPDRRDGLGMLIEQAIGRPLAHIESDHVQQAGGITGAEVLTINTYCGFGQLESWNDYLTEITGNDYRNKMIATIARYQAAKAPTLILTDRIEHAEKLRELSNWQAVLVHGGLPKRQREAAMRAARQSPLTIGTINLLGEGLDISCWTNLALASPISSRTRLLQAIGRVIRNHPGKDKGRVIDFVDDHPFSLSSFRKRAKVYEEKGYPVEYLDYYGYLDKEGAP
jgi:superfamily II DNA or RNA helicase